MLDLSAPKAPFDIALPYGLSVTVKPLTTAGMAAAQAAARRSVEAIERQARERAEAGLALDSSPDLAKASGMASIRRSSFASLLSGTSRGGPVWSWRADLRRRRPRTSRR
jgi:hypothetical protein